VFDLRAGIRRRARVDVPSFQSERIDRGMSGRDAVRRNDRDGDL
jgi:hypothetical protein